MELFSVVLSPGHPDFSDLYKKLNIREHRFTSERKAIQALRRYTPDIVVADFIYGYGNNYAGVNVSNLDVLLYSLQKSAPDARCILFCEKNEIQYTQKLPRVITIAAQYVYPIDAQALQNDLQEIR